MDESTLDQAIEALKTYDWGTDRKVLQPIDDAVVKTHGDAAARKELETKLAAVLGTGVSRDAKDFLGRTLMVVGTAASVSALAALLPDKDNSHMARYALERMPAPEAAQAIRDALPKLSGALKAGAIGSLGVRRDVASVAAIAAALTDADKTVACAAACALGNIGNADAAKALGDAAKQAPEGVKTAVADGLLACAEQLLADGNKAGATAIYRSLAGEGQPKHVRLAATRGMLAVAGRKE